MSPNKQAPQISPATVTTSTLPPVNTTVTPPLPSHGQSTTPTVIEYKQTAFIPTEQPLVLETPNLIAEFTPKGGCLGRNELRNFLKTDQKSLISVIGNYSGCKAFGVKVGYDDLRPVAAHLSQQNGLIDILQENAFYRVKKTFKFNPDGYGGHFVLSVQNISNAPQSVPVDLELGATSDNADAGGLFSSVPAEFHEASILYGDDEIKREYFPFNETPTNKTLLHLGSVTPKWMSTGSLYWLLALLPNFNEPGLDFIVQSTGFNMKKSSQDKVTQTVYETWVRHPIQNLQPYAEVSFHYDLYLGPKDEVRLAQFASKELNESIDYGFFRIVARPMYQTLNFLNNLVHNWGLAIILITLLINIILLPLHIKGYTAAKKMQEIHPELKKIQEKHKEDKVKLQQETMALMSSRGVNPMSGCLPLLPQIPVFFGLNACLMHTFELRHAPFCLWLQDLSGHDPYFILPVVMAVLMLGYQKMMPMPAMDPTQAKIMKFLPIIFSVFMVFYPSGLSLYVITNTVLSMIRQFFLMRLYKTKN